jgi:chromate transporter
LSERTDNPQVTARPRGALAEVAAVFLRLGLTAFGGPAAHIAMMRRELVQQRRWVSEQHFLDLLGATNLIPGPNSTEMTIHLGYHRAGWPGLVVAGSLFILPAMCMVLAFAWAYVRFGETPELEWLLYGIKPVVIAIVAQALWGLARTALKSVLLAAVAVIVVALYVFGANEIALLFGGGLAVVLVTMAQRRIRGAQAGIALFGVPALGWVASAVAGFSQATLFFTFLKIGSVLYGSGYVLLAFLRNDFVERLGWLTEEQLLDAVAVGQFTPGPVFTTATFVGYIAGGFPGALLATLGIFLPAFLFVALTGPIVPRMRRWPLLGAMLDGVNVAAVGLMAAVLVVLTRDAVVDWFTVLIALVAGVVLVRTRLNSAWLVVAGGALGIGYRALLA